jgi:hypothetical protein
MLPKKNLFGVALFILFANIFFFRMIGSLAVSLFLSGLFIYILSVVPIKAYFQKHPLSLILNFLIIIFLIILIPLRASIWIQIGLIGSYTILLINFIYCLKADIAIARSFGEQISIPFRLGLSFLASAFSQLGNFLSPDINSNRRSTNNKILVYLGGFVIGFVVITILLSLFSSADPIFAKYLSRITSLFTFDKLITRIVLSSLIAVIILPIAGMVVHNQFKSEFFKSNTSSVSEIITIIMTMVFIAVGFFLLIEWPYVFVNVARETDLSKYGISTYSEYVRRGFAELLIAGTLIYTLIWLGFSAYRQKQSRHLSILSIAQIGLVFECLIYLLSIGRRIILYWQFHGLTLVRFYGGIFLIFVFGLSLIMLLRHFRKANWIKIELYWTLLIILFLGLFNAESFIVRHHPPTVNNRIDNAYLSRFSADGYEGWIESYKFAETTINKFKNADPATITSDNRRDLAVSQSIINTLSRSYLRLIQFYGSDSDKAKFTSLVSRKYYENLNNYLKMTQDILTNSDNKVSKISELANNLFGSYIVSDENHDFIKGQFDQTKSKIRIYEQSLSTSPISPDIFRIVTNQSGSYSMGQFSSPCYFPDNGYSTQVWCIPSYYVINSNTKVNPTPLDYVLMLNFRYKSVYKKLKIDIPIENLINLQNSYINIYYNIMTLPENLRTFNFDTGTEGLFLENY